ncbi:unnamed protein product [Allacma fusca]|uniref:Secreted protein n=1 Tax=Allacma fusca TaxID=39272 RepID=A0A8J2LQS3_9HEXA|nr:unnamed protein product [Allacma fusca]
MSKHIIFKIFLTLRVISILLLGAPEAIAFPINIKINGHTLHVSNIPRRENYAVNLIIGHTCHSDARNCARIHFPSSSEDESKTINIFLSSAEEKVGSPTEEEIEPVPGNEEKPQGKISDWKVELDSNQISDMVHQGKITLVLMNGTGSDAGKRASSSETVTITPTMSTVSDPSVESVQCVHCGMKTSNPRDIQSIRITFPKDSVENFE